MVDDNTLPHEINTSRKSLGDFFGIKELITLIGFAVTVGMGWASLSGQIMLLDQRQQYKETQLQEDINDLNKAIETLTLEIKSQKRESDKIVNRVREVEENVRRLWRESKQ